MFLRNIQCEYLGIQRGHQNTLENYPSFLLMLGLGSIEYPLVSSIGGAIWLLGRLAYFQVNISQNQFFFFFSSASLISIGLR